MYLTADIIGMVQKDDAVAIVENGAVGRVDHVPPIGVVHYVKDGKCTVQYSDIMTFKWSDPKPKVGKPIVALLDGTVCYSEHGSGKVFSVDNGTCEVIL